MESGFAKLNIVKVQKNHYYKYFFSKKIQRIVTWTGTHFNKKKKKKIIG